MNYKIFKIPQKKLKLSLGFDQLLQAPNFFSDTIVSQELLAQNTSHKKYFTKVSRIIENRDVYSDFNTTNRKN